MPFKGVLSIAAAIAFLASGSVRAVQFEFDFENCPSSPVEGAPGEVKTIEIYPTLTTTENDALEGAHGWSFSMGIAGVTIRSIEVKGIVVDTIFDEDDDWDPDTPPIHHDHYPVDLGSTFTSIAAPATHVDDPSRKGAISAILLHPLRSGETYGRAVLQPAGAQRIAKVVISAIVPEDDSEREVTLKYENGFKSTVSQPVSNAVTFQGESHIPGLGECRFTVRKQTRPKFGFGFEGAPSRYVWGAPGEVMSFAVYSTLSSSGIPGLDGPESWAMGVGIAGGTMKSIDLKGIRVSAVFDHDGDPGTPPQNPYPLDLSAAWKSDAELATHADDPSRLGAISMVILSGTNRMSLQPNGTQRIARIVVEAAVPEDGSPREVALRFEDGFKGTGSPRKNSINAGEIFESPSLGECRFILWKTVGGMRVPGDSDGSGLLDISDAVFLFGKLFLGNSAPLPCGRGSPTDQGNISLLDWQPDGAVDISDGIALLEFLFLGGPAHHLAIPGNELKGGVPIFGC